MATSEAVILLVEGNNAGENSLAPALRRADYRLRICHTGTEALAWCQEHVPDLVIFDASTTRFMGERSCRWLKRLLGDTPLIHVRSAEHPEVRADADLYLSRPLLGRRLVNRVRMLLPENGPNEEVIRAGPLTLYPTQRWVDVAGVGKRRMTPKVAALLLEFLRQPGTVLTRDQLFRTVWQTEFFGDKRTLDVHIRWAREVIEVDPAVPRLLRTVRGVGYIFAVPPLDGVEPGAAANKNTT
jgi:DNA-binding response OmpR family regulator